MRRARRFTLSVATAALLIYACDTASSDEAVVADDWTIEITPAPVPAADTPAPAPAPSVDPPAASMATQIDAAEYQRIYRSIPFNRSEYRVNPGYRHDATMEILTGNARHQTIVRHEHKHAQPVRRVPPPARPSRILTPFSGWSYFPGLPYWSVREY